MSLLPKDWLEHSPLELARLCPLQPLDWQPFRSRGLHLSMKREDLLGNALGGNKVYKLYGHLKKAKAQWGSSLRLASYGGAWSNHLYALAFAARQMNVPSLAVVRGERPERLSAMLNDVQALGMQLEFVSREEYRRRNDHAGKVLRESLDNQYGTHFWVPEGGSGPEALLGLAGLSQGILDLSTTEVDVIATACGTGGSLAGLLSNAKGQHRYLGVAVLKAGNAIANEVEALSQATECTWELDTNFHCGGYAKLPDYLFDFICKFESQTQISLDPIYTAKLMYGLTCLAESGKWRAGTHIVAVHSGGLQGRRGWACF